MTCLHALDTAGEENVLVYSKAGSDRYVVKKVKAIESFISLCLSLHARAVNLMFISN